MMIARLGLLEVTNFVIQLIEMTELKEGGRRVKLADIDNQVEIRLH